MSISSSQSIEIFVPLHPFILTEEYIDEAEIPRISTTEPY